MSIPRPIRWNAPSDAEGLLRVRRFGFLRSAGAIDGLLMAASMVAAGGLDYSVNVMAGRWLAPVDFGVFVTVTAVLQALTLLSIAIRMVVAVHMAELVAQNAGKVGAFVRGVRRWSLRWGLVATALAALVSPLAAPVLQLSDAWPLWAGSLMALPLFMREAFFGVQQGMQAFALLGLAQVIPALLRLVFATAAILAGGRAFGAILAQPLSALACVGLMLWWLRSLLRDRGSGAPTVVSWSCSASTMAGLAVLAVMTNLDAIFVKLFYSPLVAGNFGPVVTLERMSLFLPWAIGLVLLPKVTQRLARGHEARPLVLLALAAALAPGLGLTALYFLFPGVLVSVTFTSAYADPGVVLGFSGLAATLFGGVNVWLNYAISAKRYGYIWVLVGVVAVQMATMYLIGRDSLVLMALSGVLAGALGNLAGFASLWQPAPAFRPIPAVGPAQAAPTGKP